MELKEFIEATESIEKYYEKELNEEQRKFWYNEFKNTKHEEYIRILNLARRECKFMPKLADLLEIKNRQTPEEPKHTEYKEVHCDKCKNAGIIPYTKEENGIRGVYYALCDCENVHRIPEGLKNRLGTAKELNL